MTLHLATEDQQKQILNQFNTDHNQLNKDVLTIRDWLKLQTHLPQCTSKSDK